MLDLSQLHLPSDVREKLAELDLELSEGDITQKGYEKKRTKLLAPFLNLNNNESNQLKEINHHVSRPTEPRTHPQFQQQQATNGSGNYNVYGQAGSTQSTHQSSNLSSSHHQAANHHLLINSNNNFSSPQTRANKRAHRRVTRHESRYHSEVRKEAVQQAIAAMKNKPKSVLPMPSKRNSNQSNRNKDIRNKYINLRSNGKQRSNAGSSILVNRHHLQSSSGHGTAGDSEEFEFSSDDDYDDEEEDELMVNREESSSGTPELNLKKIKNLTISMSNNNQTHHSASRMPHSSSEEASSSTASSSTQERQLMSSSAKHLKKQQQPLPLPPRVVGVQESHCANHYRNEYNNRYQNNNNKNYHHKSSSSSNQQSVQQTQLFQLKDHHRSGRNHSSRSSNKNNQYSNSPINSLINLNAADDKPPALPQHQQKLSSSSNQQHQSSEEHLLLSFDDERPPERTPKRIHSKQQSTESSVNETSVLKQQTTTTAVDDLISLEPNSIDSFNLNNINNNNNEQQLNTMMSSSSSNHSSSNNNTSLISGAIDEPLSLSNQLNSIQDNQPPEYDQVYGDHSGNQQQQLNQDNQCNRSLSNRSRISNDTSYSTGTGRYKVSAKIQQLLNTLKRPKKRPLDDFYKDDDFDPQFVDPNGPKPEGSTMSPIIAEQLQVPSGLPKSLESALLVSQNLDFIYRTIKIDL